MARASVKRTRVARASAKPIRERLTSARGLASTRAYFHEWPTSARARVIRRPKAIFEPSLLESSLAPNLHSFHQILSSYSSSISFSSTFNTTLIWPKFQKLKTNCVSLEHVAIFPRIPRGGFAKGVISLALNYEYLYYKLNCSCV